MARLTLILFTLYLFGCNIPVPSSTTPADVLPTPSPTPTIPPPADDVLIPWMGTIGSTDYHWNGKDLFVGRKRAKKVGIFSQAANKYRESFPKAGGKCDVGSFFSLSAIAGDLVGYEHESGFGGINCGVESGEWRYGTVDVSNTARFLDLRNFFTEEQLLRAFLANPQLSSDIQKSIDEKKLDAVPATLEDLSVFLTRYDYQIFDGNSYFKPDYLQRFVFHHVDGETICVRVSATSTSTAGRAIHDYAEIYLPIPDRLRLWLQKADAGDDGFLMKDAATKVGTKPATFELKF